MFKAQILRRNLSLFRRGPSASRIASSAAQDGHHTIRVQRVVIKKPFIASSRRRLVGIFILTATIHASAVYLKSILFEDDDDGKEQLQLRNVRPEKPRIDKNQVSRTGAKDGEETGSEGDDRKDEPLFFFPSGFAKPKAQTSYGPSDPVYREFLKVAKDTKRRHQIRDELISILRNSVVAEAKGRMGNINPKEGNVWLEFHFPRGPPIEYEQPGWELTADLTLRATTYVVDKSTHTFNDRVFMPTHVAWALYEDSKRRAVSLWQDTKKHVGWETKPNPDAVRELIFPKSPTPPTSTASSASTPASPSSTISNQQQSATSPSPSSSNNPAYERFRISIPDPIQVPVMNMSHLRRKWLLNREERLGNLRPIPRGTLVVTGMIETIGDGDMRRLVLDVHAAYDPLRRRFVLIHVVSRTQMDWYVPRGPS